MLDFSLLPIVYIFSFIFKDSFQAYLWLLVIFALFGHVGIICISAESMLEKIYPNSSTPTIYSVWLYFPLNSFISGFLTIFNLNLKEIETCERHRKLPNFTNFCKTAKKSYQNLHCCPPPTCEPFCSSNSLLFSLGKKALVMIVAGVIFFFVLALFEREYIFINKTINCVSYIVYFTLVYPRLRFCSVGNKDYEIAEEDEDVQKEQERVDNEVQNGKFNDILTVHRLSKAFGQLVAVRNLTFGVDYKSCFGLLGVNGAGKTTSFSMLVGEILPDKGDAYMLSGSVVLSKNVAKFQSKIGYCPQFNALLGKFTGWETLKFYAKIRGIPKKYLVRDVTNIITMVGLEEYSNVLVGEYSGGTMRKLSIAVALLGNPKLLFLDEPTSGVDPASRRKIWKTLEYAKQQLNCSIVITSHSMDECEALCSRIAIMGRGSVKCLGSSQHLRSKYCQGFAVRIMFTQERKFDEKYCEHVKTDFLNLFSSAQLKDEHQGMLRFHITDANQKFANIFEKMLSLDETYQFEDFRVSDTTLEQVFLYIAREGKQLPD